MEEGDALIQSLQRDFNCTVDPDRGLRKSAVTKITKRLLGSSRDPAPSPDVLQYVVEKAFLLADSVEKCRDIATNFVYEVVTRLPSPGSLVSELLPVMVNRIGVKPSPEESEELRLLLLKIIASFIINAPDALARDVDKVVEILTKSAHDSYPEIKKETARSVILLRTRVPDVFVHHAPALVRALSSALSHQHSRVRSVALEAIGVAVPCGAVALIKELQPGLRILASDRSAAVREIHARVMQQWLKHIPDVKDIEGMLLPLLLLHINDEIASNRDLALVAIEDVAEYRQEELMHLAEAEGTYAVWEADRPVAPFSERPSAESRALVSRALGEFLPPLLEDLVNWTVKTRSEAASLLRVAIVYTEANILEFLDQVLNSATKSCRDEDSFISSQKAIIIVEVVLCSSQGTFLPKILSIIDRPVNSGASSRLSCLIVLAALMRGARQELLISHIPSIISSLEKIEVASSQSVEESESDASVTTERVDVAMLNDALADTMISIITTAGKAIDVEGQRVFHILIQLLAVQDGSAVPQKAAYAIALLSSVLGYGDSEEGRSRVFQRFFASELRAITKGVAGWTKSSHERLCFEALLRNIADATTTSANADNAATALFNDAREFIVNVLRETAKVSRDAQLRIGSLGLLDDLCTYEALRPILAAESGVLLHEVVVPNLVWRAGRISLAVRIVCSHCLRTMLRQRCVERDQLLREFNDMVPVLKSSLDDDEKETRLMTCHILYDCFDIVKEELTDEQRYQLYPELLSRLDDSSNDVRVEVAETISSFLRNLPSPVPNETQVEYITKRLLIHLDDTLEEIRKAVYSTLMVAASRAPSIVADEATGVRGKLIRGGELLEDVIKAATQAK